MKSTFKPRRFFSLSRRARKIVGVLLVLLIMIGLSVVVYGYVHYQQQQFQAQVIQVQERLSDTQQQLDQLKSVDQYQRNEELQARIEAIETNYTAAVKLYEKLDDFAVQRIDTGTQKTEFAQILRYLAEQKYQEAEKLLAQVNQELDSAQAKIAADQQAALLAQRTPTSSVQSSDTPTNTTSNTPPANGYNRQVVSVNGNQYTVSLVAGELGSTRVIVDTASGSDCANDCPVLSLGDYVARNGAYAGVNGTYFCPASYPSCAGKTNSYDLLVMNKDKTYFNSDNNVYSVNPGVVFFDGSVRFIGAMSGWGRDTGPTGVLSNYPLLVSGGNIVFGGDDDPKKGSRGNRSFVANKGNTVYIGVVHNVTVAESALALQALGMENALNLDSGGSTALWAGGYKVGPGRNIPNAILFVRK